MRLLLIFLIHICEKESVICEACVAVVSIKSFLAVLMVVPE